VRIREIAPSVVICAAFAMACSNASVTPTPTPTPIAGRASPSPATTAGPAVRYVAIGASDAVGIGAADPVRGSWPARLATRLPAGSAYVNLGVSGSLAIQARTEQLPGAIAQRPTLVTVWLAVNDLNATIAPASYRESLAAIVDPLVARTEATIFVGNVPDLRPVPAYAAVDKLMLAAQITAYNEVIAAVAARDPARVVVVDLHTGSAELVSNATVARDGFHPSDAGYLLIADRFATAMRAKGVPLRS
jgi:lysophospholipase L1-like esterase